MTGNFDTPNLRAVLSEGRGTSSITGTDATYAPVWIMVSSPRFLVVFWGVSRAKIQPPFVLFHRNTDAPPDPRNLIIVKELGKSNSNQ